MENPEENKNAPLLQPAIIHGLLISAVLIILSLGLYIAGLTQTRYVGWISTAISVSGIIYAIFNYRNNYLDGYISYARSVGYGVLVGLVIGIVTGIFAYLLYGFLSPELLDEARLAAERQIYRTNPEIADEEVGFILKIQELFISPGGMLISSIIGGSFQGLLFGLIGGIFVRRTRPESFEV
jgi:hypothetical protein